MSYLRRLFMFLILWQSILSAQTDSTNKRRIPSGLIDAAPFAIKKVDFKPQINLAVQTIDAAEGSTVNSRFDYYVYGDTLVRSREGSPSLSLKVNRSKKIIVFINSSGYLVQPLIIDLNENSDDTVCIVKMKKCKKGDAVKVFYDDQESKMKYPSLNTTALEFFLKLNPKLKIKLDICPKENEEKIASYLISKIDKKRISYGNCEKSIEGHKEYIVIKIRTI